jgi:hypothetical protein
MAQKRIIQPYPAAPAFCMTDELMREVVASVPVTIPKGSDPAVKLPGIPDGASHALIVIGSTAVKIFEDPMASLVYTNGSVISVNGSVLVSSWSDHPLYADLASFSLSGWTLAVAADGWSFTLTKAATPITTIVAGSWVRLDANIAAPASQILIAKVLSQSYDSSTGTTTFQLDRRWLMYGSDYKATTTLGASPTLSYTDPTLHTVDPRPLHNIRLISSNSSTATSAWIHYYRRTPPPAQTLQYGSGSDNL